MVAYYLWLIREKIKMKSCSFVFWVLAFFFRSHGLAADTTVLPVALTLEQVVSMARDNSPDAVAAWHAFRSAYWNYRSYRADNLPSFSLSSDPELTRMIDKVALEDGTVKFVRQNMLSVDGALTLRQNIPLTGGSFFVQSTLQSMKLYDSKRVSFRSSPVIVGYRQSLFGYNQLKWNRKTEPLRYREAQKALVETLELVAADASRKFFALARAQRNYQMACYNYANADTLFQFAKGRYNIGTITENELLQLEVNCLTESANRMDAVIEMDECRQALGSLLGWDKDISLEVRPDDRVPRFRVEPELAFQKFCENSPEVDALQLKLLESRGAVAQARGNAGLKAELYLQCGLSQAGSSLAEAYEHPMNQQQVSIGFALPVLDWGRERGKIKVARSRHDLVEVQVKQQQNDQERNVRKLVMQFNLQAERVNIARKTVETANRRYDVARKMYLLGKSSVLDLNVATTEKDNANRNFLSALSTYWNLYYVLRSMTLYDFEEKREIREDVEPIFKVNVDG